MAWLLIIMRIILICLRYVSDDVPWKVKLP